MSRIDPIPPALSVPLIDQFQRAVTYVRLSVTDRCDLRCVYCMEESPQFLPKADVLTLEEIERLGAAFIRLGTRRLRITGGEPLTRRNVMSLIEALGRRLGNGLDELTLTTNGTRLVEFAPALAAAGVKRINVSLDTLDRARFAALSRRDQLPQVLAGIKAAAHAGLKIKINTVALRGENEDEIASILSWCGDHGYDLCLIETMPLGEVGVDRCDQYLPLSLVRENLRHRFTLDETSYRTGGPARYFDVAETGTRIGFITPMTHNFCESCNRVRLTCTGTLYLCLGQDDAAELRPLLRAGADDAILEDAIRAAIARKPKGHDFEISRGGAAVIGRAMSRTGG